MLVSLMMWQCEFNYINRYQRIYARKYPKYLKSIKSFTY